MKKADKIAELIRHDHGDVINGLLEILQDQQDQIDAMDDELSAVRTDCPHCGNREPEQEGWPEIERRSMDRRTMDFYDRERAAEIYAKAGITPDTTDDELAAMARLGKLRERAKKLTEQYTTHDLARQCQALLRELLLGEKG